MRREASWLRAESDTLRAKLDGARGVLQEAERESTEARARLEERSSQPEQAARDLEAERHRASALRDSLGEAREALQQVASDREARIEELNKKQREIDTLFKGIAADVAKASNEEFRKQAAADFARQRELAEQELKQRVEPIGKELEQLRTYVGEMEKARAGAYEGVSKLIEETQKQVGRLNSETGDLREILRSARHRGQWGEATLENIFELAGLRRNADFFKQASGERGMGIVDFVVRLPGGKRILIDSKTPFDAYRNALSAESAEAQRRLLERHAKTVWDTARRLAARRYQEQFDNSRDFVIMWIPTDSILEGATRAMPALIEETFSKHRVLLATPVTMIALVSGLAAALRQEEERELLHKNALAIQAAGQRLYDGVRWHAQVYGKLGSQPETVIRTYDEGIGSVQRNLLQGARQMREFGGGCEGSAAPEPSNLHLSPRRFNQPDLVQPRRTARNRADRR